MIKLLSFSVPTFCHEKQRRRRTCVAKKLSSSICTNIRTTRVSSKTTNRFHIMYPVSLVYFCRIYAKKQRGGGLRKQKAKVFAASLRSFPAIIQAKENWTKVVKKPGQTTTALLLPFASSSSPHIWPSRCVFRKKTKKLKNGLLHAKLCCTKYSSSRTTMLSLVMITCFFSNFHTESYYLNDYIERIVFVWKRRSLKSQEQFVTHQPSFCSSQLSTKASKR